MKKIKTSELTGAALDWAVAKCDYDELSAKNIQYPQYATYYPKISPSTDWAQGGPIIEREKIGALFNGFNWFIPNTTIQGKTPLIAAMRCYVASKFGDEVEIPEELV